MESVIISPFDCRRCPGFLSGQVHYALAPGARLWTRATLCDGAVVVLLYLVGSISGTGSSLLVTATNASGSFWRFCGSSTAQQWFGAVCLSEFFNSRRPLCLPTAFGNGVSCCVAVAAVRKQKAAHRAGINNRGFALLGRA